MNASQQRNLGRQRRAARVHKKVRGSDSRPRLSVFRSNRYIYLQLISDESGRTLASASSLGRSGQTCTLEVAAALGKEIAEKCRQLSIGVVVFDRNGYRYHGRVKAIADAAREAGLKF
jgi:large subunit ribosomal protein L18